MIIDLTDFPEGRLVVNAEEDALARLWLILLDNAVKYTENGGQIRNTAEVREETVAVAINDTGVGISREDLPHVFDCFWRADKVRSRAMGELVLGLRLPSGS